jgi:hypothetical protein
MQRFKNTLAVKDEAEVRGMVSITTVNCVFDNINKVIHH